MPGTAVARSTSRPRAPSLRCAARGARHRRGFEERGDSSEAGARRGPREHDRALARLGAPVCDRADRFGRDDLAGLQHNGVVSDHAAVDRARRPRGE